MYVSTQPRALTLGEIYGPALTPRARHTAALVRRVRRHPPPATLGASAANIAKGAGINAATAAVSFIPIVGPFLAPIIGPLASLFGQHHAQAVAKEAAGLNNATPIFLNAINDTMTALQNGQISEDAAISALNAAQSAYYSGVSSIIKKSGTCKPSAADHGDRLHTDGMSSCNAACSVGCRTVEPAVYNLTQLIKSGGGSYTVAATQDNGAIAGTPQFTVSYTRPAGVAGASSLAGIPMWYYVAGGGVLLLVLFMAMKG